MKYYSTNNNKTRVSLREAVLSGLAADNGLYMPEFIPQLPKSFFSSINQLSFIEIAFEISKSLFGDDIPENDLHNIVEKTFDFKIPLIPVEKKIFSLELFHGPTLAFKDIGARFMSQILQYLQRSEQKETTILVATSGDTGSAVANSFLGIEGIKVIVLYPKGLVSEIQEKQFTTLGKNITALEIDGTFDDCQRLVKQAFMDKSLNQKLNLTSANSINLARFIPQSFYYFWGYAQMPDKQTNVVVSVPSGNFGNLTAGLLAMRMGLPINKFVAATNINNIVPEYLTSGNFLPRSSVATIANAMDVGNPSNFARILALFNNSHHQINQHISGCFYTNSEIENIIKETFSKTGYLLDPHGAIGFMGLKNDLETHKNCQGFFIETAHPAKFQETVEKIIQQKIEIPARLQEFMKGKKQSIELSSEYQIFKEYLYSI